MQVTEVCALSLVVPLAEPVRLGTHLIQHRHLAAVRISTDAGLVGQCIYVTRDVPVLEMIENVGQLLVGRDPLMRAAVIADIDAHHHGSQVAYLRAVSLIEVALWDIAAKAAGLSLSRLLGGFRESVPVLQVCGYGLEAGGVASVQEEVGYFSALGIRLLKLMVPKLGARDTYDLVARCQEAAGEDAQLGVDFHYAFGTVSEAAEVCDRLDELGLMFIEDPFDPRRIAQTERLATRLSTPIAAGEDIADGSQYARLSQAVAILRVDPLTVGGLAPATAGLAVAVAAGCDIFPHGLPELNAAIAGAHPEVVAVEVVLQRSSAESFAVGGMPIVDGALELSEEPGLGLTLDWNELERGAVRAWSSGSSA